MKLIVENPLRQNRMIRADEALALGLVDHVLEPVEFLDESLELLVRASRPEPTPRPDADLSDVAEVVRKARARVDDVVHGEAPAPYRALELIEGAAALERSRRATRAEEDALAELLPGHEAQAAIYAFDVVERRLKRSARLPGRDAAADPARRRRRRRADGDAARDALPPQARGSRRAHRRRRPSGSTKAVESIRGELAGLAAKGRLSRGQGAVPRLARDRGRGHGGVRRLRPRARGGLRGARREAGGLRRARASRRAGVPARHEHLRRSR